MKKMKIAFCVGIMLVLAGCSKGAKEMKIVHEHHIYVHSTDSFKAKTESNKLKQSKGIDPRYDHKPGMIPPKKEEKK